MSNMQTPYFICDEQQLMHNLTIIDRIRKNAECKVLFATKSFALNPVLKIIYKHTDGAVTSGAYEAIHAFDLLEAGKYIVSYSPAFSEPDFKDFTKYSTHLFFNSWSQAKRFRDKMPNVKAGMRINPRVSAMRTPRHYGGLSDYSRPYSRLGLPLEQLDPKLFKRYEIDGLMLHVNCENPSYELFKTTLEKCESVCKELLKTPQINWISLGGGISYTSDGYPVEAFCNTVKEFADKYQVEVLLEPGHAIISNPFRLVASVQDIVDNDIKTAILDTSAEAHLPDALLYPTEWGVKGAVTKLETEPQTYLDYGPYEYILGGSTCLSGDIFGTYRFKSPLNIGDKVVFLNTGDYSMVKNSFFNGIKKPNIYLKRTDGRTDLIREFSYSDYLTHVS